MKYFLICVVACLSFVSCSSDKDPLDYVDTELNSDLLTVEFPVVPSDTTLRKDSLADKYEDVRSPSEDVRSRAWEVLSIPSIYLIANYNGTTKRKVLEVPISGSGTDRKIRFCLFIRKGKLYATNKVDEIPITGDCILSSVSQRNIETKQSATLTTPSGKKVNEPYGDRLFRTESFTFSFTANRYGDSSGDHEEVIYQINYEGVDYSNKSGSFQSEGWFHNTPLVFNLNRYTSKVKANLIITDYTLGVVSILKRTKFELLSGTDMNYWSWMPFITDVANKFDVTNKNASGKKTFPLIETPQVFEEGSYSWFTGGVYYEGIGKRFFNEDGYAYLFPQLNPSSKLCYSFYYRGTNKQYRSYNTLEIKLSDIVLDPNVENEITTIFHVNDLIEAMNVNSKSRAGFVTREDPDFGTVMEIPHEVFVTYK